ncbi:MAG: class I SAM-dependent methyltransferase [Verrucomicrobiota bacterium]
MQSDMTWQYDEFKQVGKDYGKQSEVDAYEPSHSRFRDIEKECREIIHRVQLSSRDILADFGCGTGVLARLASDICSHVYAVDVSLTMLHYAKSKSSNDNITFCHAGYLSYEHSGDSPTVITSSLSFHHLPDFWKGIALQRLHTLLAPKGKFFLVDVILDDKNPIQEISSFIDKQTKLGGDFLREDAESHFREEFSTYDWVIDGLLDRTGFHVVEKNKFDGIIAAYLCEKI